MNSVNVEYPGVTVAEGLALDHLELPALPRRKKTPRDYVAWGCVLIGDQLVI